MERADDPRRRVFVGVGVNLSALFARTGWRRTSVFLQYVQPPGTSLQYAREP